jgi:hypothetical protein
MEWAKTPVVATSLLCATCIAVAAAVPGVETAAERAANSLNTSVNLSALEFLDAFSATPLYEELLADPSLENLLALLAGIDATNATPLYVAFLNNPSATTLNALLGGIDATDAVPLYAAFLGNPNATTLGELLEGIDATDAVPLYANFIADPSADNLGALLDGIDATSALTSYFDGGLPDVDAVSAVPNLVNFAGDGDLSRASGLSGIDAFGALPVWNAVLGHGEIGALAPSPGAEEGDDPVGGIDAFSAVPGFLGINPPAVAPDIPWVPPADRVEPTTTLMAPTGADADAEETLRIASEATKPINTNSPTVPSAGQGPSGNIESSVVPQAATTPAPPASKDNQQNVVRGSEKYTPEKVGDSPILFGSGAGADNGMPGWQSALSKLGIGGGEPSAESGSEGGADGAK